MGAKNKMFFKNKKIDLHIHTCFSDGVFLPAQIFEHAQKQKIKIISITDHNNIDAYSGIENLNTNGIQIVLGMEVDVLFEQNCYHILMYNFNKQSKQFLQYLKNSRNHDIAEFHKMINALKNKFALKITRQQIENFVCQNQYFDKVRLNNFLVESGFCQNPKQAFYDYTKDIEDKTRYCISAQEFFKLASNCGATTSIAHPHKYLKFLQTQNNLHSVILKMQKMGLDAIEVYNNRQTAKQKNQLKHFAKKYGLAITGGSDFHQKLGTTENKHLATVLGKTLKQSKVSKKIYKNT